MIGADTLPPGDDEEDTDVMWRPEIAAQIAEMRRSSSNMRAAVEAMPDRPTYPIIADPAHRMAFDSDSLGQF